MNHEFLKLSGLIGCLALLLVIMLFLSGMLERTNDALLSAAESGNIGEVVKQLDYGADINARNRDGITPLHFAALSGHRDVVEFLINRGANVKAKASQGGTPLYFAVVMEHKDVADLLIDHGAKPDNLNIAAISKNREIAEMLIARGVDSNAREKNRILKLRTEFAVREEENHWQRISTAEDVETVLAYLDKYPQGNHAEAAKSRLAVLEEEQLWQQAKDWGAVADIQAYLDRYPQGRHASAAQKKLAEINRVVADERDTGTVVRDCPYCPEMVVIPAGSFERVEDGSAKRVTLKSFALGKTEVTQGQWEAVMGNNPSHFSSCGADCPVEQVSWNEAQVFIKKLNELTGKQYRLPSESEWEYACMGGEQREYCGSDNLDAIAWHQGNSGRTTHKVAEKKANAFGLYDMSGNVWEWVEDSYLADLSKAPADGSAWQGDGAIRVLRGGSWIASPRVGLAAGRNWHDPEKNYYNLGFRVAQTLP